MSTCPNCGLRAEEPFNFCPSCGTRAAETDGAEPTLLGRTLNEKYRLEEEIGQGSMGTVYLAEHIGLRKKVALKVLHPDLQLGEDALIRFQREGIAAGKFSHPNAIQIFDFDREGSRIFYLAMEYVDGQSLKQYVRENAPVAPREAVGIVRQVLLALAEAHLHGIVHRDLKPDNIMVQTASDGALTVKVLDFGLSKLVDRAGGASLATQTGMILGTPLYMSPEQCAGEPADARSDLYATGLMLYELLAGALPFKGTVVSEILLERASTQARPIVEVRPDLGVPDDLDEVLRCTLQHDRKKRFPSAQEMIAALDAVRYETVSPGPRRRSADETAATVRLGASGASTRRRGSRKTEFVVLAAVAVLALVAVAVKFWPSGDGGGTTLVSLKAPAARSGEEGRYLELLSRARDDLRARRPQDALSSVESALRLPCADAEGYHVRGLVFRAREDLGTALVDFEEAIRMAPSYAAPHCGKGWVAYDRDDLDVALASFEEAFALDGSHADALTGKGAVFWRKGELEAARSMLRKSVDLASNDGLSLYYLGRVALDLGAHDEAIDALIRSKRADARDWRALAALGQAYVAAGRASEAEPQLRAALEENAEAIEAVETLATLLVDEGRFGEARTVLDRPLSRRDDVASLHVLEGLALHGQGKAEETVASLERAVARDPGDTEARLFLGILLQQRGDLEAAAEQYRAILDEDDSVVEAHHDLGLILVAQQRPVEAIEQLERAVGRDPELASAHRALGVLYMDWVVDHDRSAEHFRRVLELEGNDSQIREWLRKMGRRP